MDTNNTAQVAQTILAQIGGGRALMMLGAKNVLFSATGVQFRISGCRKISHIMIDLAADDTYTVKFVKVGRNYTSKVVSEHEGVYCDSLADVIYNATGLYLSL